MTEIPQLNITCGTADCANGRHAFNGRLFKKRGKGRNFLEKGVCKACGANPVDWPRVYARNRSDVGYTIDALTLETIRWDFWNRPFNEQSLNDLSQRGRIEVLNSIRGELERIVGPVGAARFSYTQVPVHQDEMETVIQYAQHAVAACCRRCIEEWHGIPNERPLNSNELGYLEFLVQTYINVRLPPNPGEER